MFFGRRPKNNIIRLRLVKVLRSESFVVPVVPRKSSTKRKHSSKRSAVRMLSLRQNKNPSFPGHAPGKDTLRAANAATKEGANGGKREGERSEQESVVPRQDKDSRRDGGHAPPQRHLERSAATMKTRFTGRKQNKRSEFCCLPVVLRKGVNGGKREGERSEQESVVPRHLQNAHFVSVSQCVPFVTLCGLLLSNLQK